MPKSPVKPSKSVMRRLESQIVLTKAEQTKLQEVRMWALRHDPNWQGHAELLKNQLGLADLEKFGVSGNFSPDQFLQSCLLASTALQDCFNKYGIGLNSAVWNKKSWLVLWGKHCK